MKKYCCYFSILFSFQIIAAPLSPFEYRYTEKEPEKAAEKIVASMNQTEKIGQLMMLDFFAYLGYIPESGSCSCDQYK